MIDIFLDDIHTPDKVPGVMPRNWFIVREIETVKTWLRKGLVRHMSLDHDLGFNPDTGELLPTGYDLLCWMEESNTWPKGEITVHSRNPIGKKNMLATIANRERVQELMK